MIHDLDESIRNLLERDVIAGSGVDLEFDAPTTSWSGQLSNPTVDVFLYDIREDTSRRDVSFEEVRDDDGRVVERRQPPRQFKLSYLISAWTKRPEDEHRLLSSLLGCLLQSEVLPEDVLVGSLVDLGRPIITQVALALEADRMYSNVWTALGGELKPAINLVVIAPFDVSRVLPFGPPVTEAPRLSVGRPDTDATETLQPKKTAKKKSAKKPKRTAAEETTAEETTAADEENGESAAPELVDPHLPSETIRAGSENDPGRVVTIKTMPR